MGGENKLGSKGRRTSAGVVILDRLVGPRGEVPRAY